MNTNQKIVSIHQPNYFPWLGYFYKIYQSDIFVFLDDVQFTNEGLQNYHYIKTPQNSFRLKIPVKYRFGDMIYDVQPRYELNWVIKHLKTIEMSYKKAPFFEEIFNDYKNLITVEYKNLALLNISIIRFICFKLGITTKTILSSEMNILTVKEEKVLDICNELQASVYYSGNGAKVYQKEKDFTIRGLELRYSNFIPFEYPQLWGPFQSNVTILDYLMNCGYDWNRMVKNQ